jgi:DNA polymerase
MTMNSLQILREKCLACRACPLGGQEVEPKFFSNVFSNMNTSRIMVIGQNPGRDEVKQGEPFVGASGRFFNEAMKNTLGMERSAFYISNACRCFSPGNRQPTRQELDACRPILDEEISIIKPVLIIALGSVAFERLTGMHGIMKHQGEVVVSPRYLVPVIAVLHPSPYNTNNPHNRKMFYDGLKKVGEFLCQVNEK